MTNAKIKFCDQSESIQTNSNHYLDDKQTEDRSALTGTARTLRKAMQVTRLNEMLDCFKDLKCYSSTIEKDLLNYSHGQSVDRSSESTVPSASSTDVNELELDTVLNRRYILLHDLIEREKKSNRSVPSKKLFRHPNSSSVEREVKMMQHVIAAQPSALQGIYLEALLNPDQWQANHHRLETSPWDTLTMQERQRLRELLNQSSKTAH